MKGRALLAASVAMTAAVGLGSTAAAASCQLQKLAEVPVEMNGLSPTIPAAINGHETRLLVDTGAFFSGVTSEGAERFGMKKSVAPFGLSVKGMGGTERMAEAVSADLFTFAGVGFKNIQFLVGGRAGGEVTGSIGQNIMGPFEVEYDFANGMMRFFKAKDCGDANLAYWSQGMALSRIPIEDQGRYVQSVLVKAQVNGHTVRVKIDSGASVSFLNRRTAAAAGVEINNAAVTSDGITYGVYGGGIETFLAPFQSFKIGDEEIKNTQLRLADFGLDPEQGQMLLGADFFLSHRILISNSQKKVYFTYNGGPVFRLDRNPGQAKTQTASAPTAAGPTPGGATGAGSATAAADAKLTASDYVRRASALSARREYAEAIAELSRAIELDPKDAEAYRARARVRLTNRQPLLAMADLDEALKLNPDDAQTLLLRAELFLASHDKARGQADIAAAEKLSPNDAELQSRIALTYAQVGLYDEALQKLDGWIAAHPRSEDLGQALGARCGIRARTGKSLDAALADCDQALRKDRNSVVMTFRGLVLLRMGRTDEALAQYAAVLRVQPKSAPALYGRGLAELKKGETTQGQADLAAATAMEPQLAQDFRRFGVAPDGAPPPAEGERKAGGQGGR